MDIDVNLVDSAGYVIAAMTIDIANLGGVVMGENETYILVYEWGDEVAVDYTSGMAVMAALSQYTAMILGGPQNSYGPGGQL